MRNFYTIGLTLIFCLALAGCGNKDAEFKAFTADFEKVTNDMIAKVDADPTEDGVTAAQAVLDGKKADLKTKWAGIKDARGVQVSQDVQKEFEAAMTRSTEKITGAVSKISDPEAMTKYQSLIKDWGDIIGAGK